ncbi:MAG TPA: thioredoxin domain-containing protein [Terriglobales bacterium]|jgi:protein-disulfide isomerase|nr:thioredoxin domain-containing protein [Terriglobales bacterium]
MRRLCLLVLALLMAGTALAQTKPPSSTSRAAGLPTEATVNSFMRRMFGWDKSLNWAVVRIQPSEIPGMAEVIVAVGGPQNLTHFYVSSDGKHAVIGDVIPFGADPFKADREALERKARGASTGPADAPVTVVEFSDLQCPHCKAAQPTLERLLADLPNTRLVFEEFPLPMHDWAMLASKFAECMRKEKPEAFGKFVQSVYDDQEHITAENAPQRLRDLAAAAGARPDAVAACSALPATFVQVSSSMELGKSLGVTGTPTLFINGRKISTLNSMPYEQLKAIVEFEAQMAPPAASPSPRK